MMMQTTPSKTQTKTTNDAGLAAAALYYEKGERVVMRELRHPMKGWEICFGALSKTTDLLPPSCLRQRLAVGARCGVTEFHAPLPLLSAIVSGLAIPS